MHLALNNLQRLICYKTQTNKPAVLTDFVSHPAGGGGEVKFDFMAYQQKIFAFNYVIYFNNLMPHYKIHKYILAMFSLSLQKSIIFRMKNNPHDSLCNSSFCWGNRIYCLHLCREVRLPQ